MTTNVETRISAAANKLGGRDGRKRRFKYGVLGPALVLLAFGQATGELIHWPYLMIKYGNYFLFLLPIACVAQFPLFSYLARHVVLTGRSFFGSLLESSLALSVFLWLVFLATSIWIGSYTGAGGIAAVRFINTLTGSGFSLEKGSIVAALVINTIFFVILLTRGKTYKLVMRVTQAVTFSSILMILALWVWAISQRGFESSFMTGLFNFKWRLPSAWEPSDGKIVLTAVIFAGLGGLWNVLYSSWVRNEDLSLVSGRKDEYYEELEGGDIEESAEVEKDYRGIMRLLHRDLWWGLGLNALMLYLLASVALSYRDISGGTPAGMGIVTTLGDAVGGSSFFLSLAFYGLVSVFLIDTWLTAADSLSKVHANFLLGLMRRFGPERSEAPESLARINYVVVLCFLWFMTFVSSFIAQPQTLIFLNGILSGLGSILLVLGLWRTEIMVRQRYPGLGTGRLAPFALLATFIFYLVIGITYLTI